MDNKVMNLFRTIGEQFNEAAQDAGKFVEGNNSAGTRVRKAMQNIKNLAQQVRIEVQEQKNSVTA